MTAPLSREQLAKLIASEELVNYVYDLQNRLGMFARQRPSLKIALIGSAPSSVRFAPYDDPTWNIWSCSPGAVPFVKRCNAHFEIHRWEPPNGYTGAKPWFTQDYINWLAGLQCPVYAIEHLPELPNSVAYPKDAILEEFGPYFMASSLSWMVCLAVAAGATEIGLWGVDMAAREEWNFQRTALQCLLWHISDANKHSPYKIKVTLPPESDLWAPPVLYGFCENSPYWIKLMTKKFEFADRYNRAKQALEQAQNELRFFEGAADNNDYQLATWVQDPKAISMAFCQPEPFLKQRIAAVAEALTQTMGEAKANGHAEAVAP